MSSRRLVLSKRICSILLRKFLLGTSSPGSFALLCLDTVSAAPRAHHFPPQGSGRYALLSQQGRPALCFLNFFQTL